MPTHVYIGSRRPPTFVDHLLAHPFEILLSLWAMLGGALAVAAALAPGMTVSRSIDQLPTLFAAAAGMLLFLGGGGILHGLLDGSDRVDVGFRREQQGLAMACIGWLIYAVCLFWLSQRSVLSWSLCLLIAAACVLRFIATVLEERRLRADITRTKS